MSGRVGPLKPLTPPFINTYSLDFDGVDDYVDCGEVLELSNAPTVTLSLWMKSTSSANRILLDFKEGTSRITIQRYSNSTIYLYVNNVNAEYSISTALNNWYNIVYVFDGSGATNTDRLKLYVNGIEIIASSFSGTIPTSIGAFTSAMDSKIGSLYDNSFGFRGNIDEVAIFDSVIPIGDLWDGSNQPTDLSDLFPVAWYRMGDNGAYKSPQWLIPNNENKDKVSNYSFEFDGVNDYVNIPNNTELNFSSAYSVSFWIKTTSAALLSPISNQSKFLIRLYAPANQIRLQLYDGSNGFLNLDNTQVFNDGKWHHIAFTTEATTTADKIIVYFDGVALTNKGTQLNVGSHLSAFAYEIGRNSGTWNFNGGIDEVSIYDSELSASEINDIYNGGEPTTISGAVAHYKMGEEATFSSGVWTVPDAVGSNDGTSANMTIEDRVGTAPSSSNNAVSFNMDLIDRVEDTPPS